ncbi:MAG: ATP-binding cassette domain-containing protein [Clostridia bacterium]|nr:ATP-binding cassette domain-containing protein [Clostridia bacterium]
MNDELLLLKDVSLSYYGTDFCIRDINLSMQSGKRLTVYGREGSGKTLLLRAIAGLEESDFGDIILDGKNLRDVAVKDRGIGFTFDFSSLQKVKSVSQIIEYPMKLRGYSQEQMEKAVESACDSFEIDKLAAVESLEDFDKAKALLARLFAIERKLYVVDDVWKDLERDKQLQIIRLLKEVAADKSVVIATQDVEFAREFDGEVVVLSKGECARPKLLEEHSVRPTNMETAILCGYAIFKSVLQRGENGYFAELENNEYSVEEPLSDIYVGKEVCFAVGERGATGFYYDKDCERIISKEKL